MLLTTASVHFEMDCTLGENSGRPSRYFIENKASSILGQHTGRQSPVYREIELSCPWMSMWCVEAAGSKETDGHGHAIANNCRECRG